jgi:hypothetical protein
MVSKDANLDREKEAMRRYLLASMLCSADRRKLNGSPGHWSGFWQELFKKYR